MLFFGVILFFLYNNYLYKFMLIYFDILKWFFLNLDCIVFFKYCIKYSIIYFFFVFNDENRLNIVIWCYWL